MNYNIDLKGNTFPDKINNKLTSNELLPFFIYRFLRFIY